MESRKTKVLFLEARPLRGGGVRAKKKAKKNVPFFRLAYVNKDKSLIAYYLRP